MAEGGISGEVVLSFVVAKDGHVRDIRVLRSTDISFANVAKEAESQQQYAPATLNGYPIDMRVQQTMAFSIEKFGD
jgi:TonB family protein